MNNDNSFAVGVLGVIVLVLIIGGAWYFWDSTNSPTVTTPVGTVQVNLPGATTPTTAQSTTTSQGTVKEFTVTGRNFSFAPETMTVSTGDTVRITFRNATGTHDLRIEGYEVGTNVLQSGQEQTISFTADTAGTFAYFCSVGNHRAMGMKGTLIVR